jgi:hypothetical protein
VSADLDALDRGVIEAGVTAAEALSRVVALEATVAELDGAVRAAFQVGWETGLRRGRAGDPEGTPPPWPRHLSLVAPIGGAR